jgi:hypothetical protein
MSEGGRLDTLPGQEAGDFEANPRAWSCVSGLTREEAVDLLDWLAESHYQHCQLDCPDGQHFAVRYQ